MNLLFVCQHGEDRSPAAAQVARELATEFDTRIAARSLGLSSASPEEARQLLTWADTVFVMEPAMAAVLHREFDYAGAVISLDIPDHYSFWSKELRALLRRKLAKAPGIAHSPEDISGEAL